VVGGAEGGRPLRVTVAGLHYAPERSGNAPYTTGLARHLAAAGMAVTAVTGYPHYPEWELHPGYRRRRPAEDDAGVRLRRVRHPVPSRPTGRARIVMESVYTIQAGWRILRTPTDVLVAVSPVLLTLVPAVLLRRLHRYRLGVLIQDLYGAALAETGMGGATLTRATAWLERWLLRRADSIVVIHEVLRSRLIAQGVDRDRIRVIPNWTHITVPDHVDVAAVRRELGWADDEVIALHAGNMGVKQGLEGLVDVARLAGERGSRVRVVLMGAGSQRPVLVERGQGLSRLTIVDPLPAGRFEAALAAADVLLLHEKPGVVEMSVPSKLTSYFMSGRPIVAATDARSGAAEQVLTSSAGVVVPAGDPGPVLEAIEALAASPDDAARMGESGRRHARSTLAGEQSLAAYADWVRDLARGPLVEKPVPRTS
jgi:colanic acid biosynthesis glycosyl transferase WcaI